MNADVKPAATPVLEGWFTLDERAPALLGSRCTQCGTYYFPQLKTYCRNPACDSEQFETVELSRTGKLWSFTNAAYQPPPPYVADEPFVPFAIAAVELDKEKLIVLGQVVAGIGVESLKAGLDMELVIERLSSDASGDKLVWKWKPVNLAANKAGTQA